MIDAGIFHGSRDGILLPVSETCAIADNNYEFFKNELVCFA